MKGQDLAPRTCVRRFPYDPKRPSVLPKFGHETVSTRALPERRAQASKQPLFVQSLHPWIDNEAEARLAAALFLLHKLIVSGTTSKLRGQRLFKQFKEITVIIVHSFAGELLV